MTDSQYGCPLGRFEAFSARFPISDSSRPRLSRALLKPSRHLAVQVINETTRAPGGGGNVRM